MCNDTTVKEIRQGHFLAIFCPKDRGPIEAEPAKGLLPTMLDVTKTPHGFKFVELEAARRGGSFFCKKKSSFHGDFLTSGYGPF